LGWSCHGKGVLFLLLGFLIGLVMYYGYFVVGHMFGEAPLTWSQVKLSILPLILVVLDKLSNGFGEETAFRAYWQRLLVDRHGLWVGIILASASFVLLHLLIAPFTAMALVTSILLIGFYGILFVWTESIFLVGALHTTFNLAPSLLGQWPSDMGLLLVNGLALIITIILFVRFRRGAQG
jgi:membrane protease YdiL (CAAX protease family)